MNKRLSGRRIPFSLLYLVGLVLFLTAILPRVMGTSAAQKTEMTYTEFKTALNAGQIRTATVGIDQISGTLG